MVQKDRSLMYDIMKEENCLLVHHGKCHKALDNDRGLAIQTLIGFVGYERIMNWLQSLDYKGKENLIREVNHEVQSLRK